MMKCCVCHQPLHKLRNLLLKRYAICHYFPNYCDICRANVGIYQKIIANDSIYYFKRGASTAFSVWSKFCHSPPPIVENTHS